MKRRIQAELEKWKDSPIRCPLIMRGARQVGKSWSITDFGHKNFDVVAIADFEKKPELKHCFHTLEPEKMIERLEFYLKQPIRAGKTLLFFDEIQLCPPAVTSLRYFKEEMPDLHVISAGSLLEFVLKDDQISFPVGRVEFLFMRPFSFIEFLKAIDEQKTIDLINTITLNNPIDQETHHYLLELTRAYFMIGGMPEVVKTFSETKRYDLTRQILDRQIEAFKQDFGKYAENANPEQLKQLFARVPDLVGHHFKYSKIDPHASNPARDYKIALRQLEWAGLINQVNATHANGIPLEAEINDKKFKLFLLDIGLLQRSLQVDESHFHSQSLLDFYQGALAEQFVGQELLAYSNPQTNQKLYFWENSDPQSSAEIDYIWNIGSHIIPIEVKAGHSGRLKSMKQFLEKKSSRLGLKISEAPLQLDGNILNMPFYLISQHPDLIKEASFRLISS